MSNGRISGFAKLEYLLGDEEVPGLLQKLNQYQSFSFDTFRNEYRIIATKLATQKEARGKYSKKEHKYETVVKEALNILKKINLVGSVGEDLYVLSEDSRRIIEALKNGERDRAKQLLYHNLIAYIPQFRPSQFLLKLRDITHGDVASKKGEFVYAWFDEGGVLFTNFLSQKEKFIKEVFGTDGYGLKVRAYWASFFDHVAIFSSNLRNTQSEIRCYKIVLTKFIATLQEIVNVLEELSNEFLDIKALSKKYEWNPFYTYSITEIIRNLGVLDDGLKKNDNGLKESVIRRSLEKGAWVVSEDPGYIGLIQESDLSKVSKLKSDRVFIIMEPEISLERFYDTLYSGYMKITKGRLYQSVWIHELRAEVCHRLHISVRKFDKLLHELCQTLPPQCIELAKVSIKSPPDAYPFKYFGRHYYMIRVRKNE